MASVFAEVLGSTAQSMPAPNIDGRLLKIGAQGFLPPNVATLPNSGAVYTSKQASIPTVPVIGVQGLAPIQTDKVGSVNPEVTQAREIIRAATVTKKAEADAAVEKEKAAATAAMKTQTEAAAAAEKYQKEAAAEKAKADAATATEKEKNDKWTKSINAALELIKVKKVFPIIASKSRILKVDSMFNDVNMLMSAVGMFDLNTNTIVGTMDPEIGYMQANCIPLHIFLMLCLLQGKAKSTRIFDDVLMEWEAIKTMVDHDIDSKEVSNTVIAKPLVEHASTACIRYHQLLVANDKHFGMEKTKAHAILIWMNLLKLKVKEYKVTLIAKRLLELTQRMNSLNTGIQTADEEDKEEDLDEYC